DMRKLYDTFKTIGHINLTLQNQVSKPQVSVNQTLHTEKQDSTPATPLYSEEPEKNQEEPATAANTYVEPTFTAELAEELEKASEPAVLLNDETTDPEPFAFAFDEEAENTLELAFEAEPSEPEPKMQFDSLAQSGKPKETEQESTYTANTPEPTSATLAEKFNTGSKSLSETISPTQTGNSPRVFFQPITDLTSAIGLNDKFRFINELFDNNATQYEEAIARVNRAVNHDEASWILQKYHSQDWAQKEETLARLKDFIRRRFV
ncbi:MAG: hypothetical protein ACOYN4_16810, partial [Bacteroidales bacterium]